MEKTNTSVLGLHLVPGSADGVLTYSDAIADTEFVHVDQKESKGGIQSDINKELRDAIIFSTEWHEEN